MAVLIITALATISLLPIVFVVLRALRIVDVPNPRSSHASPVCRGGGLACLIGIGCGLAVAQALGGSVLWAAVATASLIAIVGLIDDVRVLSASLRLAAQASVGALLGWIVGGTLLAVLVGLLVLMVTVNVVNFMDGINGISGLTVGLWGVTALVMGTTHHSRALVPIGAVAAGAAFGFLPANVPKAHLFLGDVGSYLFGGLIAVGLLVGVRDGVPVIILLAPLSVYVVDTTYTLIRRVANRSPILSSHRQHVYQRLVADAGISHPRVALFAVASAGAVTGCFVAASTMLATLTSLIVLGGYLASVSLLIGRRSAAITGSEA